MTIGDHFTSFISEQVHAGRYGSASDVVRAGLRLLEEHETRARVLQEALIAGEQSGEPRPFDSEAFLTRMRAKYAARHGEEDVPAFADGGGPYGRDLALYAGPLITSAGR
ncbi:MAG: type II toxin-antitoxin system ParD family antitoxin [Sphingobium sp.]